MRFWLSAVVAGVSVASALPEVTAAQSQSRDTLPFRKGQWAVEFPIRESYSITLLRFGSNRSAVLVDGAVSAFRQKRDYEGSDQDSENENQNFTLRLGRRAYHPITSNTAGFVDFGITPGFTRSKSRNQITPATSTEQTSTGGSLGVFLGVGGSYFITPRVSLGAWSSTQFSYSASKDRLVTHTFGTPNIQEQKSRGYGFSAHTAVITGGIYF